MDSSRFDVGSARILFQQLTSVERLQVHAASIRVTRKCREWSAGGVNPGILLFSGLLEPVQAVSTGGMPKMKKGQVPS